MEKVDLKKFIAVAILILFLGVATNPSLASTNIVASLDNEVEIEVEADRDYELYSELGYKTEDNEEYQLTKIKFTKRGSNKILIESLQKPIFIQIDPCFRIPQVNIDNCIQKL